MDTIKLLHEITDLDGPSGYEEPVARYVETCLEGIGELQRDRLGSVLCTRRGQSDNPRVMIAGHMDEIGFIVKFVAKEGVIRFSPLGGWWSHAVLAQRVRILTSEGPVTGIVGCKPPHLLPPDNRNKVLELKDMYIDVGARDQEHAVGEMCIRPGDAIVPDSNFAIIGDGTRLLAKAWDDRAGVAMMIQTLQALADTKHPNTVCGAATVQEEVGLRGAQTAVEMARPDVAIITETAIAGDTPGIDDSESNVKLGGGPAIYVMDGSMIPNTRLRDLVIQTCRDENIPHQLCLLERGGTDGGRIHLHAHGVPSIVIGVPTRHIHSHAGIIQRDDYEQCVQLITALCLRLDAATVEGLTEGR